MPTDWLLLLALAVVWWIPTFMGIADLQRREGVRRVVVWRWTAVLCVPVVGAILWFTRGRDAVDADLVRR